MTIQQQDLKERVDKFIANLPERVSETPRDVLVEFIAEELANKRTVCFKENCDSTVARPLCSKHWLEELEKARQDEENKWRKIINSNKKMFERGRESLLKELEVEIAILISEEMIICMKEKTPTSRLTSLAMKIDSLLQPPQEKESNQKEIK